MLHPAFKQFGFSWSLQMYTKMQVTNESRSCTLGHDWVTDTRLALLPLKKKKKNRNQKNPPPPQKKKP